MTKKKENVITKKKTCSKSKSRRSKVKYPNLNRAYNLKTRSEVIDYDYIDKLSEKDKAYLDKFTKEYVGASMDKNPKKNLHKNKRLRKSCYDANNSRNRDVLTRAKAMGKALYIEDVVTNEVELNDLLRESFNNSNSSGDDSNEE